MFMIGRHAYRVNTQTRHFEEVIQILTEEFNLVNGFGEPTNGPSRVLVWEDELGIGRYRVHCK